MLHRALNLMLLPLALATAAPAFAQQAFTLQKDRLTPGGTVAIQLGFINEEIAAVSFQVPLSQFPLQVNAVQIFWRSGAGQSTNAVQDSILLYRGTPGLPGFSLVYESDPPQLTDGFLNQFDLPDQPVISAIGTADPQTITVGLKFSDAAAGRQSEASIVSDRLGCVGNTSFIYDALFNQWRSFCFYGGQGVFVIRAVVEKQVLPCPSDLTGDRFVDDADFVLFAQQYAIFDCNDPAMPGTCSADLNSDQFVDDTDFVTFAADYASFDCP